MLPFDSTSYETLVSLSTVLEFLGLQDPLDASVHFFWQGRVLILVLYEIWYLILDPNDVSVLMMNYFSLIRLGRVLSDIGHGSHASSKLVDVPVLDSFLLRVHGAEL
jgi:hypothetical protein